ncbi:MAG: type 4a pilus biogenesis protein PilO, partial [Candidatus Omnitrophota bacterium]|nr:type 4a pilus biogenesis protein PilO [Candidatus Omnitrophota bacterium]
DFLKKATKNEIMAFTVLICAFMIVGYFFLLFSPLTAKLSDVSRKVSKLQSDLTVADLAIGGMPKLRSEIEELKKKAIAYSNKLPKEEEFPALLEGLSAMAQNTDVKITKILPAKDTEAQAPEKSTSRIYQEQKILINAQCGYHQLGTFISELENAERFMEISDIIIESLKTTPRRHNVQLVVKTFILKDKN